MKFIYFFECGDCVFEGVDVFIVLSVRCLNDVRERVERVRYVSVKVLVVVFGYYVDVVNRCLVYICVVVCVFSDVR